jgi:TatD DNase family protein
VLRLVDSHCHINFDPLGQESAAVLERAQANGVGHMLCVSVNLEDYPQVLSLARAHDNVFASVGVHPNEREGREPQADELADLARDPEVVAIGETGLDYFRSEGSMDWQQERFRNHIHAARAAGKPLIIHTRDAAADTMKILREESARDAGGVMHCFVEDWDIATQALDIGFYISFSGIVTFKNAGDLREVARKVPMDRVLVETDSPYLAPVPYRGKTNEPSYVRYVAECVADLRAMDLERFAEGTTDNFFHLFSSAVRVN